MRSTTVLHDVFGTSKDRLTARDLGFACLHNHLYTATQEPPGTTGRTLPQELGGTAKA